MISDIYSAYKKKKFDHRIAQTEEQVNKRDNYLIENYYDNKETLCIVSSIKNIKDVQKIYVPALENISEKQVFCKSTFRLDPQYENFLKCRKKKIKWICRSQIVLRRLSS